MGTYPWLSQFPQLLFCLDKEVCYSGKFIDGGGIIFEQLVAVNVHIRTNVIEFRTDVEQMVIIFGVIVN